MHGSYQAAYRPPSSINSRLSVALAGGSWYSIARRKHCKNKAQTQADERRGVAAALLKPLRIVLARNSEVLNLNPLTTYSAFAAADNAPSLQRGARMILLDAIVLQYSEVKAQPFFIRTKNH
jgi:hypothetical protein